MNCFEAKKDPGKGEHVAQRGPRLKLKQKGELGHKIIFYVVVYA